MSAQDNFHHVRDFPFFELPGEMKVPLPYFGDFQLTKFMVLQLVAALAAFFIFRGLSKQVAGGKPAQGRFWNFWEMMALFIRDELRQWSAAQLHHE